MSGAALKKKSKLEARGGDGGKDERNKRAEEDEKIIFSPTTETR